MEITTAVKEILYIQETLRIVNSYNIGSSLWPKQNCVQNGDNYDYIIAGGGTAGCVLANRLTADGNNKVLLIEAGGDPAIETKFPGLQIYLSRTSYDWNQTLQTKDYECHKESSIHAGTGKVLGGTSKVNYMTYARGNPGDYQIWADAAKNDTWLWENVLPYYIKAEGIDPRLLNSTGREIHGTEGPLKLTIPPNDRVGKYLEALKEIGQKEWSVNGKEHYNGYFRSLLALANCTRQSTAFAYLSPARYRSNLHVLKHTMVIKVLINKSKRAVGVQVITKNNKTMKIYADKEVIVSLGALYSPQLLQLSGIGPKKHLSSKNIKVIADLPVGQNLRDHVAVMVVHKTEKVKSVKPYNPCDYAGDALGSYVALNVSNSYSDYKISSTISDRPLNLFMFSSFTYAFKNEIVEKLYNSASGREIMLTLVSETRSRARGHVLLNSPDPVEYPIIKYELFTSDSEMEEMLTYVKDFLKIENSKFFKDVKAEMIHDLCSNCKDLEPRSMEYWRCYVNCFKLPMYHFSGTCAMGTVVDSQLRVIGVQGLRVVDASIMPVPVSGSCYMPTIMVAEKAADMIKNDHV